MQSKDILRANSTHTTWAIATSWMSKEAKSDPARLTTRGQCAEVRLVDPGNFYYLRQVHNNNTGVAEWRVAPTTERTKGWLIERVSDGERWVVKSADILAPWGELDIAWTTQEASRANAQAEEERRNALRRGEDARVIANNERIEVSLASSLKALLGEATPVAVNLGIEGKWNDDYSQYHAKTSGRVTVDVRDFQRLLEAVYEAREAVN
jgi:hypothetical protein